MNTDQVNYLNIGLMMLSCIVAFFLPFELFLFSYAILGPLHYLTEISWLRKKQFFSPGKWDYLLLGLLTLIIVIPAFSKEFKVNEMLNAHASLHGISRLVKTLAVHNGVLVFVSFATGAVLILTGKLYQRLIGFALILLLAFIFRTAGFVSVIFLIFLPTLVHVFVFTGVFILTGALKSKSLSGILSLVVFIGCAVSLFVVFPHPVNSASVHTLRVYNLSFDWLNKQIFSSFLHQHNADQNALYFSPAGILITRFIAYAYTYHYLNWFSKTSVIKWHLISKRSMAVIFIIWVLALILYFTNYRTGFVVLYFLSLLHVVLEFPLNFRSFKDVGSSFRQAFSRA